MKKIIINAVILDEEKEKKVSIIIKNNIIQDIIDDKDINYDEFQEVIDAENNYVLPGLVDINCELTEPGFEYKEDIKTLSVAAAKGGYTTVNCIPRTNPVVDNKIIVRYILDKFKTLSKVNMLLSGNIKRDNTEERMSEIYEMKREGITSLSDCNEFPQSTSLLNKIFRYSSMFNMPIILSSDDKELRGDGIVHNGKYASETGLKGIPKTVEEMGITKSIMLANEDDIAIHLTKITTFNSTRIIKFAKSIGLRVTVDTCPQYFTLTDENIVTYDTKYKIFPPLRTETDRDSIIRALQDGTINAITSGHSPDIITEKKKDFVMASNGISSIETAFYVSYNTLVVTGLMTLSDLIKKMSTNPCQILNIDKKGEVKEGYYADLFIFNKEVEKKISVEEFESKAKYSPYDGFSHLGEIQTTIVGGEIVYAKY